jgi:hypothetical protein
VQVVRGVVREPLQLAPHGGGGKEVEREEGGEPLPVGGDLPYPVWVRVGGWVLCWWVKGGMSRFLCVCC